MGKKRIVKRSPKKQRSSMSDLNRHHITPRSRILPGYDEDKDNIVRLPKDFHASWHWMFGNATPEEVCRLINIIMRPGETWTHHDILELRQRMTDKLLPIKCRLCGRDNHKTEAGTCTVCGEKK